MFLYVIVIALCLALLFLSIEFHMFYKRSKEQSSASANALECIQDSYNVLSGLFTTANRELHQLKDDVRDTVRILAKDAPITYETYQRLVAECACPFCIELFRDYLDFSEGIAADAAPTLSDEVLSFKEEATGRGDTVTMPTPEIIVVPANPAPTGGVLPYSPVVENAVS